MPLHAPPDNSIGGRDTVASIASYKVFRGEDMPARRPALFFEIRFNETANILRPVQPQLSRAAFRPA